MALEAVRVIGISVISFLIAFGFTPALIGLLKKLKLGKQIRQDAQTPVFISLHKAKEGTPTMGGVIIWGTVLGIAMILLLMDVFFGGFWSFMNFIDRAQTYLPLAALFIGAIFGLMDDILGVFKIGSFGGGIHMKYKFWVYVALAAFGAWWFYFVLDWHELHIPFFGNIDVGWWYFPIFMFVIIASAFSANETDGLDGLLGGVSLFAYAALVAVAFAIGRYDLAVMGGAIIGALLAFLWFNIHPAKFFMGDTGSMALGVTLGVMAMLTNTVILLPFFFIIPVIESLSVIIQRISKKLFKRKIFISTPIHHHFEAIGWPESQVTMRFWIISIVSVVLGIAVFFIDKFVG